MDNKVTIIGAKESGKTTYLTGMYMCMSGVGCKNYTIGAIDPNQDVYLERLWDNLNTGKFPTASDKSETFCFHIAHCYKPVCDFEWLDYPGGLLSMPEDPQWPKMKESIETADCLLVVLDGAKFQIDACDKEEYKEKLIHKLTYDKGIRNEIKEFNSLSQKSIKKIPPVCLLITKCDLINLDYKEAIESALTTVLSGLLASTPLAIVTSVSLGENIAVDGPDPFHVEEPIAFAVLTILLKYMTQLNGEKSRASEVIDQDRRWFKKWLDKEEVESARKTLDDLNALGNRWIEDAYKLLDLFHPGKVVYAYGRKQQFHEFIRKLFQG